MSSCPHSPALLCPQPEEVAQEAAEEPLIEPLMEPEGESYEGTPQVRGSQGWEGGVPEDDITPSRVGGPQRKKLDWGLQ